LCLSAAVVVMGLLIPSSTVVVGGLALGAVVVRFHVGGLARASAGAATEEEIASRLRRLRVEAVLYGLVLPGRRSDVDVILIGPIAAAVEVKRGSGRLRVGGDGSITAGARRLPGRPLDQAARGARAVARVLDVDVYPILCISDMRGRPQRYRIDDEEVIVCSARHLVRVVRRLPACFETGEGRRAVRLLAGER
jgi:hypothetical protein